MLKELNFKVLILFCFVTLFFLFSCIGQSSVDKALDESAKNRIELETVIHHFSIVSKDKQKLQAAKFLIRNMPAHYHTSYNQQLYSKVDSLNRSGIDLNKLVFKCDSFQRLYRPFSIVEPDIKSLKSEFLIRHIDKAVDIWRSSPWYDPDDFDHFCEYILPYAATNEAREYWLDYYHTKYKNYLSNYLKETDKDSVSLVRFCDYLNGELIKNGKMVLKGNLLKQYPPLMVDHIQAGICDDYGARTIFIMRSLGMPVCFDFSPQWSGYTTSHLWNVLIDSDNKIYPFMGFDESTTQWKIPSTFHCSKVFRKTYSIQQESLAAQHITNELPDFLSMSIIKDVTDQYIPTYSVEVDIKKREDTKVAYLCIFKKEWSVAHWAEIKWGKAVFEKMGTGVMYLPTYYDHRQYLQAGYPFYLDSLGKKKDIIPVPDRKQRLVLERKYPYSAKTTMFLRRMLKGCFQGSNTFDFRDADELYTIQELPKASPNIVEVNSDKKYRYVRYTGSQGSFTNIAEIEFYSLADDWEKDLMLHGRIIGTDNNPRIDSRGYDMKNVFDGDPLTFFNTTYDTPGWVGLDLGVPKPIRQIRYIPRNDDNNIRVGDTYELVYWENGQWSSLGTKVADGTVLVFDDCPVNALFLLHNHTRGNEERIFTYEDGRQVFW